MYTIRVQHYPQYPVIEHEDKHKLGLINDHYFIHVTTIKQVGGYIAVSSQLT